MANFIEAGKVLLQQSIYQDAVVGWLGSLAFDVAAISMSAGGMIKDPSEETTLVILAIAGTATLTGTALGIATGVLGLKGLFELALPLRSKLALDVA